MTCKVKELRSDFYCLRTLLSDLRPDLPTWNEALERRLLQIQSKINELQEESLIRQKERALGIIINFLARRLHAEALGKEEINKICKIIEVAKRVKRATSEEDVITAMTDLHQVI